jgi:multidrug resistance protein, MATE family
MSQPSKQSHAERPLSYDTQHRPQLGSTTSSTPIAEAPIGQDLQDHPGYPPQAAPQDDSEDHDNCELCKRAVVRSPAPTAEPRRPTKRERETALAEQQKFPRKHQFVSAKRPRKGNHSSSTFGERLGRRMSNMSTGFGKQGSGDEESALSSMDEDPKATETTALLRDPGQLCGGEVTSENTAKRWHEAVASGTVQTKWQREAKVLARSSRWLILTFMLQYSLPVASIFSVGHIGKVELGAVSIASMTANITGYAVYQGLATSLDTLCAQAYGSGNKTLVGLQMQRMVCFLWVMTIPIGMVWLAGTQILEAIVPEKETAALAGLYLKIILVGAPGYVVFESGKRFVQAQGLFSATLYVLLLCVPFNAFLNWLFVWVSACGSHTNRQILMLH